MDFIKDSPVFRNICTLKVLVSIIVCALIIGIIIHFTSSSMPSDIDPEEDIKLSPAPLKWKNNEEIQIFRHYLHIPTVQPDVDYTKAVIFLKKQAAKLDLPVSVYYPVDEKNPVVVMTWEGSQPQLPSIMLNSHMDVVPVYEEFWTHPPFGAEMNENGDIFARGAQDMKCVGMQYLAAIRALKQQGTNQLKRNIHVAFVPDEETGGMRGMAVFSKSDAFKSMNIQFVLDEGGTAIDDQGTLPAYYVERTIWQIEIIFHGQSGHGSKLLDNTPGEKLAYVVNKLMDYRAEEKRKLNELKYQYGNITSINLTVIKGGVANNVIPAEMSATFDMRVSVNTDIEAFEQQINQWCNEAGGNITVKTLERGEMEKATRVDKSNPFWVAFKNGVNEAGLKVEPTILGPSSDMKYIRRLNISAIGFSPLINTVPKLHDHNEYLNADTYLAGIEVYKKIIPSLGNV